MSTNQKDDPMQILRKIDQMDLACNLEQKDREREIDIFLPSPPYLVGQIKL